VDKREWLNRGYKLDGEIRALELEKERLLELSCKCTNPTDFERLGGTRTNVNEDRFVAYSDYSIQIDEKIQELINIKCEIHKAVYTVTNTIYRTLLIHRYINFKTWEQIAVEMHYTFQWIHILHGKALKEIKIIFD